MRDKLKESVLKSLRSGTKLTEQERSWMLDRLKLCDKLVCRDSQLNVKYNRFKAKLAKLEIIHVADGSEYSNGYLEALKQFRDMLEGEGLL